MLARLFVRTVDVCAVYLMNIWDVGMREDVCVFGWACLCGRVCLRAVKVWVCVHPLFEVLLCVCMLLLCVCVCVCMCSCVEVCVCTAVHCCHKFATWAVVCWLWFMRLVR